MVTLVVYMDAIITVIILIYKILHGIVYTPNSNVLLPLIGAPGTGVSTRGHKYKIKPCHLDFILKRTIFAIEL